MSKQNLERELKRELGVLNEVIDGKIIRGQSYAKEARRHKFVLSSLSNLRRARTNWMTRSFSTFSLI
ncbi:MAG: hypothetical protein ABL917_02460 [Parcubacteria group bacterium]